jgi:predicted homoserine dehydrogenase-like protein
MIVVDKALQTRTEQGNPIKVAILGGGSWRRVDKPD